MKVRDWMTKDVVTIGGAAGIRQAAELMKVQKIRHLPVVERGRLIGIVSDRDLRQAIPSQATALDLPDTVQVREIMTKRIVGVAPDVSIAKAADLMLRNKIGCLPVLERGDLPRPRGALDVDEKVVAMREEGRPC